MRNRNPRFIIGLGVLIGSGCLAFGCLGAIILSQFAIFRFMTDPNGVVEAGKLITPYKAPDGYSESGNTWFGDPTVVLLPSGTSKKPKIRLFLIGKSMEKTPLVNDDMLTYAKRKMSDDGYPTTEQKHNTSRVLIHGEQVPLLVVEGSAGNQLLYRYMYSRFSAPNNRLGAVEFYGPTSDWDQELVDAFLTSMQ